MSIFANLYKTNPYQLHKIISNSKRFFDRDTPYTNVQELLDLLEKAYKEDIPTYLSGNLAGLITIWFFNKETKQFNDFPFGQEFYDIAHEFYMALLFKQLKIIDFNNIDFSEITE